MICLNCKKQIPDSSVSCPYCGNQIAHKEQLHEEIKFRRYQRWFFYIVICLVFLGMLAVIVKIYTANSKYLATLNTVNKQVKEKETALTEKDKVLQELQANLEAKNKQSETMTADLKKAKDELDSKTVDYKKVLDEQSVIKSKKEKCELDLTSSDANIYSLIIKLGKGVNNVDLMKIPVADSNLGVGTDSDNDGLSDEVEAAIGTNKNNPDTDGDGYTDKDELLKGFNPTGPGKINLDSKFAGQNKGRILLQVEGKGEAWYVSPGDGKRYFLGNPANAFRVMRDLDYWTAEWKKQAKTVEPATEDQVVISTPSSLPPTVTTSTQALGR